MHTPPNICTNMQTHAWVHTWTHAYTNSANWLNAGWFVWHHGVCSQRVVIYSESQNKHKHTHKNTNAPPRLCQAKQSLALKSLEVTGEKFGSIFIVYEILKHTLFPFLIQNETDSERSTVGWTMWGNPPNKTVFIVSSMQCQGQQT